MATSRVGSGNRDGVGLHQSLLAPFAPSVDGRRQPGERRRILIDEPIVQLQR